MQIHSGENENLRATNTERSRNLQIIHNNRPVIFMCSKKFYEVSYWAVWRHGCGDDDDETFGDGLMKMKSRSNFSRLLRNSLLTNNQTETLFSNNSFKLDSPFLSMKTKLWCYFFFASSSSLDLCNGDSRVAVMKIYLHKSEIIS